MPQSGPQSIRAALRHALNAAIMSRLGRQHFEMFIAHLNQADLATLAEWLGAGKITPVVDRCYPLSEIRAAREYQFGGHAPGKVVITGQLWPK